MEKNGQHGCLILSILSIVICTFVTYKIPFQKAHVICKIINVQNGAKLAHTNVRGIKSTIGYSERSSILTASEKHPPYKIFDYSVKIYFVRYHTPLKNFMDNPPTHNEKEKHTSPCLFSHNKGMNTMICVLQTPFPPLLSSTRSQVYSKVRLPTERVSYGRVILRTRLTRAFYVVQIGAKTQADARVALSDAFSLRVTRYKIDLRK